MLTTNDKLNRLMTPILMKPSGLRGFKIFFNGRTWEAGFVKRPMFPHTICSESHDTIDKEVSGENVNFDEAVSECYRKYVQMMKKINGTDTNLHTEDCASGRNIYDCPGCRGEPV